MTEFEALRFSWNGTASTVPGDVEIEDDTLRDGLQGSFVRKPSLDEKLELMTLSSGIGCKHCVLGFPASSDAEYRDSRALLGAIAADELPVMPWFLARAKESDLAPIIRLRDETGVDVGAAFFLGTSPIRRYVEGWRFEEQVERVEQTMQFLRDAGVKTSFSIEDAGRTPPDEIDELVSLAAAYGAYSIAICDTVGESTPHGVDQLVRYVRAILGRHGAAIRILWHGHNDRGLAFANAVAAMEAGTDIIGGAFLGIGERTGNTALEQVVMYLHQLGRGTFDVQKLIPYCLRLARATATDIPDNAPLVGRQTFATCTGTHSAAILKAREFGPEFEDYVFSSIPASALGIGQTILVGPTSGLANARFVLDQAGVPTSDALALDLLAYAKQQNRALLDDEITSWYERHLQEPGS